VSDQPQPVNLPTPPAKPAQDDVIVINQNILYYVVIALVFFVAGFITASTTLSSLVKSTVAEAKAEMSVLTNQAMGTAIALAPQSSGSVASAPQPTETPVPIQNIDVGDSPSWGPADAKVTIVEFSDFQCPYCEQFHLATYNLLKQNYGNEVRFVYKHFPLTSIHPEAYPAALASECAREQDKFWEFHDLVYQNQDIMSATQYTNFAQQAGVANMPAFEQCVSTAKYKDRVQADYLDGVNHFVTGTPTFYVNGLQIPGAIGYEQLAAIIEQVKVSVGS
jgi:protein-disulfide isomerase